MRILTALRVTASVFAVASSVQAQILDINPSSDDLTALAPDYSPYVERNARGGGFAENLLWGDTHLHTSLSADAGLFGTTIGPDDAYRFARGEVVTTSTGQQVRAIRPLDFLVVADHAENLGIAPMLAEGNRALLETEYGRRLYDLLQDGRTLDAYALWGEDGVAEGVDIIGDPTIDRTAWDRQIAYAEQYNDPGTFTALIGFEWTQSGTFDDPGNIHRVVIFRDGAG